MNKSFSSCRRWLQLSSSPKCQWRYMIIGNLIRWKSFVVLRTNEKHRTFIWKHEHQQLTEFVKEWASVILFMKTVHLFEIISCLLSSFTYGWHCWDVGVVFVYVRFVMRRRQLTHPHSVWWVLVLWVWLWFHFDGWLRFFTGWQMMWRLASYNNGNKNENNKAQHKREGKNP